MTAEIDVLDLRNVFVNEVAGSITIFLILALIFILIFAIKFKFDNKITFAIIILFLIAISSQVNTMIATTLLIVAIFFGWQMSKLISRG